MADYHHRGDRNRPKAKQGRIRASSGRLVAATRMTPLPHLRPSISRRWQLIQSLLGRSSWTINAEACCHDGEPTASISSSIKMTLPGIFLAPYKRSRTRAGADAGFEHLNEIRTGDGEEVERWLRRQWRAREVSCLRGGTDQQHAFRIRATPSFWNFWGSRRKSMTGVLLGFFDAGLFILVRNFAAAGRWRRARLLPRSS